MINTIDTGDVVITILILIGLLIALLLGVLFELAGETVPGWHTISFWAHRSKVVRYSILAGIGGAAAALIIGLSLHFASTSISR